MKFHRKTSWPKSRPVVEKGVTRMPEQWVVQFYSDTNMGLYLEGLDMRVPSNLWEADREEMTITFDVRPSDRAIKYAEDLGADWLPQDD